ncbi:HTH domain-containing protein [Salmonella enterica subsp. enterica]|nr:HTH domain-containing protein [Salmonella enterica subsp. enterica]
MLRNETLPQDELAVRLSVSTRTVSADIAALNMLLTPHGAQFTLSRGNGYQLVPMIRARYQLPRKRSNLPPRAVRAPAVSGYTICWRVFNLRLLAEAGGFSR